VIEFIIQKNEKLCNATQTVADEFQH